MAPVPSFVVTTLQSPSPVNSPCALLLLTLMSLALSPILPTILPLLSTSTSLTLPPSNLSTSGQPHLPACPQDINWTQRLVSVYIRAHLRTAALRILHCLPTDRSMGIEHWINDFTIHTRVEECKTRRMREGTRPCALGERWRLDEVEEIVARMKILAIMSLLNFSSEKNSTWATMSFDVK